MKKIVLFSLSLVLVAALFSSCRSHKKCAAYGKANPVNVSVKV